MNIRKIAPKYAGLMLGVILFGTAPAYSCDTCALYSVTERQDLGGSKVGLSLYEELTSYERRSDDRASIRDGERTRYYSVTEAAVSYALDEDFNVQFTLPLVVRTFDQFKAFRKKERTESGLGDVILSGHYTLVHVNNTTSAFRATTFAGVKFPTGDTGSLSLLDDAAEQEELSGRHHTGASGLGAEALTLGSGSFDFPFGISGIARYGQAFLAASAQYTIRTEGSFDYRFGNDFLFNISPGYFLYLTDENAVDMRLSFSGEQKADDEQRGETRLDSDLTHFYLGPVLQFGTDTGWLGSLAFEIPVYRDQEVGVLPEYRLQASFGKRFG